MEKSVKITLIIAATVLILGILGFIAFDSVVSPSNTMAVQGSSVLKVLPDTTSVGFSIQTSAKTAEAAKSNNSVIFENLIAKLAIAGFDRSDLKTESFNIYPEYDYRYDGSNKIKGYIVQHNLKIELNSDKAEEVGKAIDAGVEAGALISYINFELSKDAENSYKVQALEKATQDARTKAEAVARGLGKKVGGLVSVSVSEFNYYPWPIYTASTGIAYDENVAAAKEAAGSTSINPSEREVTAMVSVTFKIK
ncbi:SIMPL domain-containing protein [Candidatus Pacearchaeota archaeon]|nr:SIMPL domain-containing protein [Candidatus Pacearchaeota archaeon]